ncbi:MAG: hypothetical protein GWP06_02830 [Actinobacteria bacterium]|nr:hypothetical protein [Actinomycetota bacterium]
MNIKIITTERKLSKSLVNQMHIASIDTVKHGIKLGYVVNVRKNMGKALLINHNDNYTVFPMNWKKHCKSITRNVGNGSQEKKFDSADDCSKFWDAYQEILKNVQQIYI